MKYLLYIIISVNFIFCSDNKDKYKTRFIATEYDGIVIDMYNDKKNHNVNILMVKINDSDTIKFYSHIFPGLWANAQIGDSIQKKQGKSYLVLKRNIDTKTFDIRF
jgi:hypothetical protein